MKTIEIPQTTSTNSWLSQNADRLTPPVIAYALEQTAGRGQRGNSWEAQPFMNLTASALLIPEGIEPAEQFVISEAVALAVADTLKLMGVEAMVKWPNDIYVGDRKICGILIEHSILGREITRTIAGIGLNINQTEFLSDAPNPVSVKQLTGEEHNIAETAAILGRLIEQRMAQAADRDAIHSDFMRKLWRGDGQWYRFFDRNAGEEICAKISSIATDGTLYLATDSGETRSFAFKEVEFIL